MLAASTSQLAGGRRDYTNEFKTTEIFDSKEELIKWARQVGRSHGFVIVILRSDRKKPSFTLGCERSGKGDRGGTVGRKKCDCPFRLKGKKLGAGDEWELIIVNGTHNHEVGDTVKQLSHSFRGRLSQEEKSLVKDMWQKREKPEGILRALQERDKHNKSTLRTIYNECQILHRKILLEDTTPSSKLLQLMSKASEYNCIEKHRANPENDIVLDFFFTCPSSLKLFLLFPTVLIIYYDRLNVFDDPLRDMWELGIYGVTSTNKIFSVAGAIFSKSTSNIQWALKSFGGVLVDKGIAMPDIVIWKQGNRRTDADVFHSWVKATNDVFPTAKLLLSRTYSAIYGIYGDVGRNTRHMDFDSFQRMWELLEESPRTPTEALEGHLMQLRREFDKYPEAVEYVIDNWFKPYKEMFIPAWTDELMHFGNGSVSSRDLLIYLIQSDGWESSRGDVCHYFNRDWNVSPLSCHLTDYLSACARVVVVQQTVIDTFWKGMRSATENKLLQIKKTFEESLENKYKNEDGLSELKELHGSVSNYALELIKKQTLLANEIVDDDHSDSCSCAIKRTHGLPCAHEIAEYKREGRPIPLECVNSHWRKLHLEPSRREEMNTDTEECEEMNTETHYSALSSPDIVESERNSPNAGPSIEPSTEESQPENKVYYIQPTKQLEFLDVCPPLLRPYILDVMDVPRDGHCGFRAIASFMGYSEDDGWMKVREDLTNELILNSYRYAQLFGSDQRVSELIHTLGYSDSICPEEEHWMTMPDMGHIIASCYNIVLVYLTSRSDLCFTFFPLPTPPISVSTSPPREIVIGLSLAEKHFVQLYLKAGHPMPPPTPAPSRKKPDERTLWETFHEQRSTEWATPYMSRIEHFKSSQPEVVLQTNPIVHHVDP